MRFAALAQPLPRMRATLYEATLNCCKTTSAALEARASGMALHLSVTRQANDVMRELSFRLVAGYGFPSQHGRVQKTGLERFNSACFPRFFPPKYYKLCVPESRVERTLPPSIKPRALGFASNYSGVSRESFSGVELVSAYSEKFLISALRFDLGMGWHAQSSSNLMFSFLVRLRRRRFFTQTAWIVGN